MSSWNIPVNYPLWNTLMNHPLTKDQRSRALLRFIRWQIGSRMLNEPVAVPYVEDTRLLVKSGMEVATGNVYTGLLEFESQTFVLHSLHHTSWFVDIGANVGMYTILAGGAVGASCIAAEPIPVTYEDLCSNIYLNNLNDKIIHTNVGVGKKKSTLKFAKGSGPANRVLQKDLQDDGIEVEVNTMDNIVKNIEISDEILVIKIDVEGWEKAVLEGGREILNRSHPTALIVELNGMGEKYGFDDDQVHRDILEKGYTPVNYEPHEREINQIDGRNDFGNTIYVNDIEEFSRRVKKSKSYLIRQIGKNI